MPIPIIDSGLGALKEIFGFMNGSKARRKSAALRAAGHYIRTNKTLRTDEKKLKNKKGSLSTKDKKKLSGKIAGGEKYIRHYAKQYNAWSH